ncbi:MAG TPA: PIN domain-containing protein, partial [Silvibacterium sp.]|jgi:predicted nucleic acid-binding protein|nr:PIN domain-containing protein [Silvibacterium sp.]
LTAIGSLCLADTNILLRLVKDDHSEYPMVREAVERLKRRGTDIAYTHQNMAEFWNASTRPLSRNGFGLSIEETEKNAREIERSFIFLPEGEAAYRHWRTLVVQNRVSGTQVHDARLAAAMQAHGLTHILTFNKADFARFHNVTALHPSDVTA